MVRRELPEPQGTQDLQGQQDQPEPPAQRGLRVRQALLDYLVQQVERVFRVHRVLLAPQAQPEQMGQTAPQEVLVQREMQDLQEAPAPQAF